MKIAILGTGKEGLSATAHLQARYPDAAIVTFSDFDGAKLKSLDLPSYDLVVRSPSVPLAWLTDAGLSTWTSATRLFFDACPAPIIGVTGTKGKGTTSSLIAAILTNLGKTVHLVGNIGTPALDVLPSIVPSDFVVYEMSSFQLWDLDKSPHVAVILGIEPDHLNVHRDFTDYLNAKANIARHQTAQDFCVYHVGGDSADLAALSPAAKLSYPTPDDPELNRLMRDLNIPGQHNVENANAALLAVASALHLTLPKLLNNYFDILSKTFKEFKGLPHRLEFLRELNGVKYYDDNFSTNLASTAVALAAFPDTNLILIAGGRDKTDNEDLPDLAGLITERTRHAVLIGESGHAVAPLLPPDRYELAESLPEAVAKARAAAETYENAIVLMSPAAASFDMFDNVYDRGAKFQAIINSLQ